jgi:hypothetical protein
MSCSSGFDGTGIGVSLKIINTGIFLLFSFKFIRISIKKNLKKAPSLMLTLVCFEIPVVGLINIHMYLPSVNVASA